MSRKRLATMVGGTVACALGIGFFMQRAETAAPRSLLAPLPASVQQAVIAPAGWMGTGDRTHLDIQKVRLTSALPDTEPPALSVPRLEGASFRQSTSPHDAGLPDDGAATKRTPANPQLGCGVSATATPSDMALVDLALVAPCAANQRVTVHHNGMMFTAVTDRNGKLNVTVPALSEQAVFIFSFADGSGSVALARVENLADFDRIVLQWSGDAGFQVHAREFGAGYGDTGHVWAGGAGGSAPEGGFMIRLGNPATLSPQLADVYTYPTGASSRTGTVALTVEAEVSAVNCGREISAQSLELRGSARLRSRDLVLSMPDCSAVGDFLVLTDMVEDLEIAAR